MKTFQRKCLESELQGVSKALKVGPKANPKAVAHLSAIFYHLRELPTNCLQDDSAAYELVARIFLFMELKIKRLVDGDLRDTAHKISARIHEFIL